MQIRSPPRLTSTVDIADRATSISHLENPTHGALVSIDLNCSEDLFYGHKKLVVKFSISFTTQIQGGFHKPITIQDAKAGYFEPDNDIKKLINDRKTPLPQVTDTGAFKDGRAEIQMQQPQDSSNIRIVVLLDASPSNMEVSASLSTLPAAGGISRPSRAFMSASRSSIASSPNDERLQQLLCWTATLGHETLFAAYLDQGPSILDMEDEFGMTPFSWAALSGQGPVIQLALQQGGCISSKKKTTQGPSPLEAAATSKDASIFQTFLKTLKFFNGLESDIPGPEEIPGPETLPELKDDELEEELKEAVSGEQMLTIHKLVEMLRDRQPERSRGNWLARKMVKAAGEGSLCLVKVLKACGAKVNPEDGRRAVGDLDVEADDSSELTTTPLMSAITNNKTDVAKYLIVHGAEDEDALRTAVKKRQHSTIRTLLLLGSPIRDELRSDLFSIATKKKDSTTLMLLRLEKGSGKLATYENLHRDVDKLFDATVVDFYEDKGPKFRELTVDDLMRKEADFFKPSGEATFKWFHLPANNMKWAEALMGKIYNHDPSLAYKVLEPKRWVRRQHEGDRGSAHARFMIPACHDFSEAFKDKKSEKFGNDTKDRHVFLFMPYLHWDEEKIMQKRSELITKHSTGKLQAWEAASEEERKSRREELLLRRYLFDEVSSAPSSHHVLHVRRTLDQSLYHNLKDTKIRDGDQAVHRYQNNGGTEDPLTVIMVDQLWLWVLVGPSGKADTIVTCFPSRDWHDVGMEATEPDQTPSVLDERRTTDVLQITKSYLQQRPNAVKTPYDLAGVITSRCSRALLDHSSDMLNFAEIYENSISSIMDEEAILFNTFNTLMQTRTKVYEPKDGDEHSGEIEDESAGENETRNTQAEKRANSHKGLSGSIMDDLKQLEEILERLQEAHETGIHGARDTRTWISMFQRQKADSQQIRVNRIIEDGEPSIKRSERHCQDYREYTLDREIPDDNDLKQVRKMTGKDKIKPLITLLEKFGRFYVLDITREITLLRYIKDIQDELGMMEKIFAEQQEALESMGRIIRTMSQHHLGPQEQVQTRSSTIRLSHRRVTNGNGPERNRIEDRRNLFIHRMHDDSDSDDNDILGDDDLPTVGSSGFSSAESPSQNNNSGKQSQSMIWGDLRERQNLPLRTITRYFKQIKRMDERAKNTNLALNTLVDLKQKHNNMIDTRTARLQAEQSHLMTLVAEKQGRTLMVFTIVTIVFLPLSFIAAFFAIPTKEFDNNVLTLGYVSKITFPLSAAISLGFIAIAFLASKGNPEKVKDKWASMV